MPFPDSLICQICHGLAQQPVPLSCNHLFCLLCIEKHKLNSSMLCPVCLKSFQQEKLIPIPYLDTVISEYNIDLKTSRSSPIAFQPSQDEFSVTSSDSPIFTHFDIFGKETQLCKVCNEYIRHSNFVSHKQFCRQNKFSLLGKAQMKKTIDPKQKSDNTKKQLVYTDSMSISTVRSFLVSFGFLQASFQDKTISQQREIAQKAVFRYNQLLMDKQNQQDISGLKQMICGEILSQKNISMGEFQGLLMQLVEKVNIPYAETILKILKLKKKNEEIDID
ncbi:Zinc finger, C3HC4 type (RING finger) domain-containing protein [Spironucleus salmonicida]|uniref:Zinc finger, C3HC4 type (RING finger) domain-containing protein n=1 Tax=Spironucleus salmonicida TaxID=348837 RepID=V6LAK5_9EUKA|nr:Zinc finger, C3HC4 type (RING finger) domain-containing protein [Spironucleus salmonicida]|eukprot:EST41490.1 Zinc finger, C3HC4 type (RING finger) domain-containing protein [Spironucleus salmonicida]